MALKKTSEVITVSALVAESAANTFTQGTINLPLDPLNNEVFVVLGINLDVTPPENIAGTTTQSAGSLSTTSRTAIGNINDNQVMAVSREDIMQHAASVNGVGFSRSSGETPTAQMPYIGIIATDDFFLQVQGINNTAAKTLSARVWGYRAKADGATYAALVQSELLG